MELSKVCSRFHVTLGIQIALGLEHEGLRRGISDAADVARREFLEKIRQVGNGRSGVRGRVSPSRAACCTPSSLLEEAARADRSCSKISFRPGGTYGYGGSSGETAYCSTIPGQPIMAVAVFWAITPLGACASSCDAHVCTLTPRDPFRKPQRTFPSPYTLHEVRRIRPVSST